jgi:hypothetical protein
MHLRKLENGKSIAVKALWLLLPYNLSSQTVCCSLKREAVNTTNRTTHWVYRHLLDILDNIITTASDLASITSMLTKRVI